MNQSASLVCVLALSGILLAAAVPTLEPLPTAVSNNAIASMKVHGDLYIFSLMGIGEKRSWDAVSNAAYIFDNDTGGWAPIHGVPGTTGRIAAMAAAENGRVYLAGGAVVDAQGGVTPVPDLNIYAQDAEEWLRGADLPVGVANAVIGSYRERYIYVIGGRSRSGPINDVQMYDLSNNTWQSATPTPGAPVFGQAGAILDDTIVVVDGATSATGDISNACWIGKIDRKNPLKISWSKLPPHPGQPGFNIAAGGWQRDNKIYFLGGTPVVTNYKGEGADGKIPQPSPMSFALNLKSKAWEVVNPNVPQVTMDNHVLIPTEQGLVLIGGTEADGKVTRSTRIIPREKSAH
ncbi:MAG TPA: kelch repeat-containing protein [Terriglobales bacterium]